MARVNFKRKDFSCEIKGFEDVWETNLEAVPLNATSSTLFCACLCGECGRRAASLQVLLLKPYLLLKFSNLFINYSSCISSQTLSAMAANHLSEFIMQGLRRRHISRFLMPRVSDCSNGAVWFWKSYQL